MLTVMNRSSLLIVTLFALIASRTIAAEPFKVLVRVQADNQDLRTRLGSEFRKEVRTFPDVAVVTDGVRNFEIIVVAVGDASHFSAAVTSVDIGVGYTTAHPDDMTSLRALCYVHVLDGGGEAHMREAVAASVAAFDSKCVEAARQAAQKKH